MKPALRILLVGLIAAALWTCQARHVCAGPYLFHLTDLGILPGKIASSGYGINANGQVVGDSNTSTQINPVIVTFVTTSANGLFTAPSANRGNGVGRAINDNGQVSGQDTNNHAVRLNPGQSVGDSGTDLGTLGGSRSDGNAINASGQVAGGAVRSDGFEHAFRTSPTGRISDPNTDLGAPDQSYSIAQGINASGQTAGYSNVPIIGARAFRTSATGLVTDAGADLGAAPMRPESEANAINASGQTVGYIFNSTLNPPEHAFRTSATGDLTDPAADLGTLPGDTLSIAYAINDAGWVVGLSGNNSTTHAMLQDGRTMYDLGSLLDDSGSGWRIGPMYGINNIDQVVGIATSNADQRVHAVRLDPIAVPEPGSLVMIGIGVIGLVSRFRPVRMRLTATRLSR